MRAGLGSECSVHLREGGKNLLAGYALGMHHDWHPKNHAQEMMGTPFEAEAEVVEVALSTTIAHLEKNK